MGMYENGLPLSRRVRGAMISQRERPLSINELIIRIVQTKRPANVADLVKLVQEQSGSSPETIINHIVRLREEGKIVLEEPIIPPMGFAQFLFSRWCRWFWLVSGLTLFTILAVFLISENAPMGIAVFRWGLGSIFILYLPGYCFVEALYPEKGGLDDIERIALSIGLSLAISPLTLLVLNFTPWGIRLVPFLASLVAVTLGLAIVAALRKYEVSKK